MNVKLHDEIINRFKRLIFANRLAHAYLFVGQDGTGKLSTARRIAQLVNCEGSGILPCSDCPSCNKITAGNHPDVSVIGANEEESIKIDDVRAMLSRVGLRAFEAKTKVFILNNVHGMTTEAANALLKTLEEPAPNTLMLLTTSVPESCLDTIKSRCHTVRFFAQDEKIPQDRNRILDLFLSRGQTEDFVKLLSQDKQQGSAAMLVLLGFVRDSLLLKNGVDVKHLLYRDRANDAARLAKRDMTDLCALNEQIVRVKSLLDENLNAKMALSLVRERIWAN